MICAPNVIPGGVSDGQPFADVGTCGRRLAARPSCGVVPSCNVLPCHPALGVSVEHQCRVRGFLYARLALAERSADIAFLSQRSACPMTPSPLTCARAWAFLRVPSGATTPQRSGRCSKTRVSIPPCLCPSDGSHRSSRHRKVVWLSQLPSFGLWQQPEARRLGAIQSHSESLGDTPSGMLAFHSVCAHWSTDDAVCDIVCVLVQACRSADMKAIPGCWGPKFEFEAAGPIGLLIRLLVAYSSASKLLIIIV